ncbi:MAG: ATP-grasp domain-containing protein [Pseudomonadota bacterium]
MTNYQVLVIGPRRGLIDVLRTRAIPFSVWQEKNLFVSEPPQKSVTAPLWNSPEKIRQQIRSSFPGEHFTHVIAGTEAAVLPAAIARRQLRARLSSTITGNRCRDKLLMKEYLSGFGIPMTRYMADHVDLNPQEVFALLGAPVVRKYRKSSGGKGLQLINSAEDFAPGTHGLSILERFIDAPEASIESFIDHGRIRFTNVTHYEIKGHTNFVPAFFDSECERTLLSLNERVIQALNIGWGMTHLEVYMTKNGPLFGEIAIRPPGGYIMNALQHAWDFNPWEAFVAMELGEPFEFPAQPACYAAAEVLHPGAGQVTAVHGKSRVLAEQGVKEFRIKVKRGDVIDARSGLGQDAGYVLHASASAQERQRLHELILRELVIEVNL